MTNTTTIDPLLDYEIKDYYLVCGLFEVFAFIAIALCTFIIVIIWRTKPRLHTVNHLLICNTCFGSIFYCVITTNNYAFLIFGQWQTSDISCRIRAYFVYSSLAGTVYSYLLQAISQFIFSFLSTKYRWLITFKAHFILICVQWITVFLVTSPSIITHDITFLPKVLCWVPMYYRLHVLYTMTAYYAIPFIIIIIIYLSILYKVIKAKRNTVVSMNSINSQKRDLQLLRNILILLGIYLFSGSFSLLFAITAIKVIYLLNLVLISFFVVLEKLFTIILDRELRDVVRGMLGRRMRVMPISVTDGSSVRRLNINRM